MHAIGFRPPHLRLITETPARAGLAEVVAEAKNAATRSEADRGSSLMILEWVLIRKDKAFYAAVADTVARTGCGPLTAAALQMVSEAALPFTLKVDIKHPKGGRPAGAKKTKRAKKLEGLPSDVAKVLALLADRRDRAALNAAVAEVAGKDKRKRDALCKRVERRFNSNN